MAVGYNSGVLPRTGVLLGIVAAAVGVVACSHDTIILTPSPSPSPVATSSTVAVPPPPATAPLAGRASAELRVVSGFDTITMRVGDTGPDLFRASTPPGSSAQVNAVVTGDLVQLSEQSSGGSGPAGLEVLLNATVSWRVGVDGGASAADLELGSGVVRGVDLASGIASATVSLPRARGTTAVVMSGGANQLRVHLRGAAPVRTTLSGGAGTVSVDGDQRSALAGGTVLSSPGWITATDRYDVTCAAGVAALTIDRG